jgi:hypothetical protein
MRIDNAGRIALLSFLFLFLFISSVHARSVTLNLAFNITDKDNIIRVNDTDYNATQPAALTFLTLEKKFISAEKNGKVLSLVFAGRDFLSVFFNTTYSTNHYLIQMKQGDNENRFLLAFTNGTWRDIDDKAGSVEEARFLAKTFGALSFAVPNSFSFFLRLENDMIDIANSLRFDGSTKLLLRNRGEVNSLTNVTIDLQG